MYDERKLNRKVDEMFKVMELNIFVRWWRLVIVGRGWGEVTVMKWVLFYHIKWNEILEYNIMGPSVFRCGTNGRVGCGVVFRWWTFFYFTYSTTLFYFILFLHFLFVSFHFGKIWIIPTEVDLMRENRPKMDFLLYSKVHLN